MFTTFRRRKAYIIFLPITVLNPYKLHYFLYFLNRSYFLMNVKNTSIYLFFKNRKSYHKLNFVNNSILAIFED